jgi:hypothetical protein
MDKFCCALLLASALAHGAENDFDYIKTFEILKNATTTQKFFGNVQDGAFRFFMVRTNACVAALAALGKLLRL